MNLKNQLIWTITDGSQGMISQVNGLARQFSSNILQINVVEDNDSESDSAWTDKNVSKYPKFYNSEITNELTNVGLFFDKNNQYNDKTSPQTESITTDSCYTDKFGNYFCEDNTRLQLIPPKLITDPKSCYALNRVGTFKDGNLKNDINDRVMNGGNFFNGINASQEKNEYWSSPIKIQQGDCAI